jgi:hypothetical protein
VIRPNGTTRCALTSSPDFTCALDASGLHTILVRDAAGAKTGEYRIAIGPPSATADPAVPLPPAAAAPTIPDPAASLGPTSTLLCNPTRGVTTACVDAAIVQQRLLDQFAVLGQRAPPAFAALSRMGTAPMQLRAAAASILELLLLHDIRRLGDPNVTPLEKALIIASYLVPVPSGRVAAGGVATLLQRLVPKALDALTTAAAALSRCAPSCSAGVLQSAAATAKATLRTPEAYRLLEAELLRPNGRLIGAGSNFGRDVAASRRDALDWFRALTYLGTPPTARSTRRIVNGRRLTGRLLQSTQPDGKVIQLRLFSATAAKRGVHPVVDIISPRVRGSSARPKTVTVHFLPPSTTRAPRVPTPAPRPRPAPTPRPAPRPVPTPRPAPPPRPVPTVRPVPPPRPIPPIRP